MSKNSGKSQAITCRIQRRQGSSRSTTRCCIGRTFVKDIDPKTWVVSGVLQKPSSSMLSSELPMAEKFRLAFAERDARLAPKRAKNARQHQRRAERNWMMSSDKAKAVVLASKATKSLYKS